MKEKKFLKITKEEMSRFPIKFSFIDYWKYEESEDRIDNFEATFLHQQLMVLKLKSISVKITCQWGLSSQFQKLLIMIY